MRFGLLSLGLLLALLPLSVGAPAPATGGAELVVRTPRHAVEVGEPLMLKARVSGLGGVDGVEVIQRIGRRWTWVESTYRARGDRLRITVTPTTTGRSVYRVLVSDFDPPRHHSWDQVVVHSQLDPRPEPILHWFPQRDGRADANLVVGLNRWIPQRPRLALQRRIGSRWTTLRSGVGRRWNRSDDWGVRLDARVDGPGALRVVGSGRGWRVSEPIDPYVVDAGRAAFDVPRTVPPHKTALRRLIFDARAGEELQVLTGEMTHAELRDPAGHPISTDYPYDHSFIAPTTGRYTVDVAASDAPGTVLVARPQRVNLDTDSTIVALPAVADARVARRLSFAATAGDVVVVDAMPCAADPLLVKVTTTGVVHQDLACRLTDAVTVRASRAKIVDIVPDSGPVPVAADHPGQPLALRFTTPAVPTNVEIDVPWTWKQVQHAWPESRSGGWVGNLDATYSSPGPHLFVVRPRRAMEESLIGLVDLTTTPRG